MANVRPSEKMTALAMGTSKLPADTLPCGERILRDQRLRSAPPFRVFTTTNEEGLSTPNSAAPHSVWRKFAGRYRRHGKAGLKTGNESLGILQTNCALP